MYDSTINLLKSRAIKSSNRSWERKTIQGVKNILR